MAKTEMRSQDLAVEVHRDLRLSGAQFIHSLLARRQHESLASWNQLPGAGLLLA